MNLNNLFMALIGVGTIALTIEKAIDKGIIPAFWKKEKEKECPIIEHRILDLESHAKIANDEMGEIRKDISDIKSDISFIRGKLDK